MQHYCKVCGDEFSSKRAKLGYRTCLRHGDKPKSYTVSISYNKGPYQLITRDNIKSIGRK
jgi:hypothetical protein